MRRIRVQGLLVTDYEDDHISALTEMAGWIAQGKLIYRETVVEGLEKAPQTFNRLFEGSNFGKLIIQVSDDPTKG